jgi:transposase
MFYERVAKRLCSLERLADRLYSHPLVETGGLSEREIAGIMGWEEENVLRIIRRYDDRQAAIKQRIRKLSKDGQQRL